MSIWCSQQTIGHDEFEDGPGVVLTYALGFSNHYPDTSGECELPASIDLATIPRWCVPGHYDDYEEDEVGPWLRLSVHAPRAFDWYGPAEDRKRNAGPIDADVVLDEEAARALRDQLTEWLDAPKVRPAPGDEGHRDTRGRESGEEEA